MKFLLKSTDVGPYYENIEKEYPKLFLRFTIEENDKGFAIIEIGTLGELCNLLEDIDEVVMGELGKYDKERYGDYDAFIEIYDERRE
jgi:hypothetical protein